MKLRNGPRLRVYRLRACTLLQLGHYPPMTLAETGAVEVSRIDDACPVRGSADCVDTFWSERHIDGMSWWQMLRWWWMWREAATRGEGP